MRNALIAGVLSIALAFAATDAWAGGRHHFRHHHFGHHHHGHHLGFGGHFHFRGDDAWAAVGVITGVALLGTLLSPPRYRTSVYDPPAYRPTCYRDRVWRRLPDGRIQTGIRTRCY